MEYLRFRRIAGRRNQDLFAVGNRARTRDPLEMARDAECGVRTNLSDARRHSAGIGNRGMSFLFKQYISTRKI
jgi:hypothetical protein